MATTQQARAPAPAPATAPVSKKAAKGKKNTDPADASKQIAARLAQLEQDAAGDKEQEAEIGASVYSSMVGTLRDLLGRRSSFAWEGNLVPSRYEY